MKIQNLSIIFLVIIIPIMLILSYYLELQQETLALQVEYDTKLAEATKEGIRAFEVNTVDWSNEKTYDRRSTLSMVNAFLQSLSNHLNVSGTAKEFMVNYIPAISVTMYDGCYTYSPEYMPVTKEDEKGIQLFEDKEKTNRAVVDDANGTNPILYEAKNGMGKDYTYKYRDDNNDIKTITLNNLTTDETKAKKVYKHNLSNKLAYSAIYRNNKIDAVINYTLDNRIYVYGIQNGKTIDKSGYLMYFNSDTVLPRITIKPTTPNQNRSNSDISVKESIDNTQINKIEKTKIEPEELEEQIIYRDSSNDTPKLMTFKYIYDIENKKLYYDDISDNFFTLDDNHVREFLEEKQQGDSLENCRYKSVSVLLGGTETTEHIKLYQILNNGYYKGRWYINLKEDSEEIQQSKMEEIETELDYTKITQLGLNDLKIYEDCSAINYYVESYAFTNWITNNLGGKVKSQQLKYDAENKEYTNTEVELDGIFNISQANDPEKEESVIVQHKKEIIKNHIITSLNLAITNYSVGTYQFQLPILNETEWEQIFSNISMITFFQGVPIGLKQYNNYAIATSTINREYPAEIYLSGADNNYHRVYCNQCQDIEYKGYRSVEYEVKDYLTYTGEHIYYYEHDSNLNSYSETACYYCIINRANFTEKQNTKQTKAYNEAIARERYYQNVYIKANI